MSSKPNLSQLMQQAQKMQDEMKKMQDKIQQMEITGEAGAGLAKVTLNGKHECKKVELDPSLLSEEKDIIEDLIAAAFNDAVKKVEGETQRQMADITGGMGLPPGFKMPF
ncbi:YbaB/EbfC family nucleoid-associated protein [Thiotrichales bacterium 19S3-7]|nr:YbaB/EbfC family nucleoid-associated protein [Thiotrichales bacterium 19S3-7]MCF6801741.1 YbaB/EbfC family nucleoid-associated protein [Thiotrichales bacterium 19S3-11]